MAGKTEGESLVLLAWPDLLPSNHARSVRGVALSSAIASLGHDCLIVTPSANKRNRVPLSSRVNVQELVLYDQYAIRLPPPIPAMLMPLTVGRLASLAKKSRAKLVIGSTPGVFLCLEAYFVARLRGLPFILDVRDSWSLEEVTHHGRLRNSIKHKIEGVLSRGSSEIWTVTESLSALLKKSHRLVGQKIIVVPNGADRARFGPGGESREYDFVFLGAPSPYRDVPRLLRGIEILATKLPRVRGLWLGWRDASLEKEDSARLHRLVSNGTLVLNSPVPHSEVPALLKKARIGLVSISSRQLPPVIISSACFVSLVADVGLIRNAWCFQVVPFHDCDVISISTNSAPPILPSRRFFQVNVSSAFLT